MSETVRYKGKLRLLPHSHDLKQACIIELRNRGVEPNYEADSYILDEFYNEYAIVGDKLYKIYDLESLGTEYDFYEADNKVDHIAFHVMFYNGGQSLEEAIETAMEGK